MASYTIIQLPILLITSGFVYLVVVLIASQFVDVVNIFIGTFPGVITEQTVNAAILPINVIMFSPALILLVIGFWGLSSQLNSGGRY